jgi:hypothetical protein
VKSDFSLLTFSLFYNELREERADAWQSSPKMIQ